MNTILVVDEFPISWSFLYMIRSEENASFIEIYSSGPVAVRTTPPLASSDLIYT